MYDIALRIYCKRELTMLSNVTLLTVCPMFLTTYLSANEELVLFAAQWRLFSMSIEHSFPIPMLYPLPEKSDKDGQDACHEPRLDYIFHLLQFSQLLCTHQINHVEAFCEEVKRITQDKAQLRLSNQHALKRISFPTSTSAILPVQFGEATYGTLSIAADPQQQMQPAITMPTAHLLAYICGLILHMLEGTSFLRTQCQQLKYHVNGPLTKREREVLSLIYRGYTQEEIADSLSISPTTVCKHRQHIYEQLGVHNEYDARLAAYHLGLFSLVDGN